MSETLANSRPITFTTTARLPTLPHEIAASILDLSNWPDFKGYGPLPGIESAEFVERTPQIVGSRIQVKNTDGSSHVEEIIEWAPSERLSMKFSEFSPPLSQLANHFVEVWTLQPQGEQTLVTRAFQLFPKNSLARIALWLLSHLLKRAIALHLRQLQHESGT